MDKPEVRIDFCDFWSPFNKEDNAFTRALSRDYTPVIDEQHPDFLFFSNFGTEHLRRSGCVTIFYTGENLAPDFNVADYGISCAKLDFGARHLYLPPCFSSYADQELPPLPELTPEMAHRPFCTFLYSHAKVGSGSRMRRDFCLRLMESYAHVDCPGAMLHNLDAPDLAGRGDSNWLLSKIRFLGKYKFNIAWENSSAPGYMTEKLTDAFIGNTVPIYWGSDGDTAPFPKEAMICANDFADFEALIARIREVNENDELYMNILAVNPLRHGLRLTPTERLADFLRPVIAKGNAPFDKDVWAFGDAARFRRLAPWVCRLRMRLAYMGIGLKRAFVSAEQKAELRQRSHALKAALRDAATLK